MCPSSPGEGAEAEGRATVLTTGIGKACAPVHVPETHGVGTSLKDQLATSAEKKAGFLGSCPSDPHIPQGVER